MPSLWTRILALLYSMIGLSTATANAVLAVTSRLVDVFDDLAVPVQPLGFPVYLNDV